MTRTAKIKLVIQMKRDIGFANITKFFSFLSLVGILYVSIETSTNLLVEFMPHVLILTAIYVSACAYITKVVRAGIIQGIDIFEDLSEEEDEEQS